MMSAACDGLRIGRPTFPITDQRVEGTAAEVDERTYAVLGMYPSKGQCFLLEVQPLPEAYLQAALAYNPLGSTVWDLAREAGLPHPDVRTALQLGDVWTLACLVSPVPPDHPDFAGLTGPEIFPFQVITASALRRVLALSPKPEAHEFLNWLDEVALPTFERKPPAADPEVDARTHA